MGPMQTSERRQLHERFFEWLAAELKTVLLILECVYLATGDEAEAL